MKASKVTPPEEDTLPAAIRKISESMRKLLASGLNRKAIVVLIKDDTDLPKRVIEEILRSLEALADKYTK